MTQSSITLFMKPFANPARPRKAKARSQGEFYPYYAGFSSLFVADAIAWALQGCTGSVLDPWNGAGTTTTAAFRRDVVGIGFDLNPVMVVVAKANLLSPLDAGVISPLTDKLIEAARVFDGSGRKNSLELYFKPRAANTLQCIALAIWEYLVAEMRPICKSDEVNKISPLPAAFFVGLFNTVRSLIRQFNTSNPTWIKIPSTPQEKVSARSCVVLERFKQEMNRIGELCSNRQVFAHTSQSICMLGDARALSLADSSIDAIITSPPYCTRLDYARATLPELLVLETIGLARYSETRKLLMGSAITNKPATAVPNHRWGNACLGLLESVFNHPSKASKTYYYNQHFSYFDDLFDSIGEISRVTRPGGRVCIVAQDSYYKDVHNDLPAIIGEMAADRGLTPMGSHAYKKSNSIKLINTRSAGYGVQRFPVETAILFEKG
ncbi:DNA methylase [Candidimonas sp. SYP-B2681]|uniref:DNA methylase n=1 Tax=Candidimonas sp. SYP-B2681 TaxID=2497686 RepID=UPI000F886C50|nr:DNA methylase [Candidimonas sp. SYP-B2681]RTZ39137.1 DNA methylase [Candidimonas sp. SYP-B2681]